MSKFWFFVLGGIACFAVAAVFAKLSIVVVGDSISTTTGASASVDEVRGWAPDVTNAGASVGFAIAGGLCMIAAAMSDAARGCGLPSLFPAER